MYAHYIVYIMLNINIDTLVNKLFIIEERYFNIY